MAIVRRHCKTLRINSEIFKMKDNIETKDRLFYHIVFQE